MSTKIYKSITSEDGRIISFEKMKLHHYLSAIRYAQANCEGEKDYEVVLLKELVFYIVKIDNKAFGRNQIDNLLMSDLIEINKIIAEMLNNPKFE